MCVYFCFYRWHDYLEAQNYVPTTIRNYNIDVKAFLKYLEEAQPSQVRLGNATIKKLMYIIKHIQKRTLRMIPGYRQNQRRKNKSRYFFYLSPGSRVEWASISIVTHPVTFCPLFSREFINLQSNPDIH